MGVRGRSTNLHIPFATPTHLSRSPSSLMCTGPSPPHCTKLLPIATYKRSNRLISEEGVWAGRQWVGGGVRCGAEESSMRSLALASTPCRLGGLMGVGVPLMECFDDLGQASRAASHYSLSNDAIMVAPITLGPSVSPPDSPPPIGAPLQLANDVPPRPPFPFRLPGGILSPPLASIASLHQYPRLQAPFRVLVVTTAQQNMIIAPALIGYPRPRDCLAPPPAPLPHSPLN